MPYFINLIAHVPYSYQQSNPNAFVISASKQSLMTSILSAGTFFGAIAAGDVADFFGRRITIITGCLVFTIGCILETAAHSLGPVSFTFEFALKIGIY